METGIIHLEELYHYIRQNRDIPHRTNDKNVYRPFKALIEKAVTNIPKKTGWYYWVDFGAVVRPVYIGKSDSSTTWNLYTRIEEELSEEYVALWATVHNEQEMLETFSRKYNNKYDNNHKRALKKRGVTHILWVSVSNALDNHEIKSIEDKLIETFQPIANAKRNSATVGNIELFDKVKGQFTALIQTLVVQKGK
ncbi:MAG: hypothetical protein WC911_10695 [Thermoleophilia bacterium]